jgi:hypothetical protein
MAETPASKEMVVWKLLEEGDTMLCLDARHAGVRVPAQHAKEPGLRLILNLNFPQPIEVTAEGISANLAFGGRRFACYIPMAGGACRQTADRRTRERRTGEPATSSGAPACGQAARQNRRGPGRAPAAAAARAFTRD